MISVIKQNFATVVWKKREKEEQDRGDGARSDYTAGVSWRYGPRPRRYTNDARRSFKDRAGPRRLAASSGCPAGGNQSVEGSHSEPAQTGSSPRLTLEDLGSELSARLVALAGNPRDWKCHRCRSEGKQARPA